MLEEFLASYYKDMFTISINKRKMGTRIAEEYSNSLEMN